jgi:hypothetical protein
MPPAPMSTVAPAPEIRAAFAERFATMVRATLLAEWSELGLLWNLLAWTATWLWFR